MTANPIIYRTATCARCSRGLWGLDAPRVSGWDHVNPADANKNGRHAAAPDANTVQEITWEEYRAIRDDQPPRRAERRARSRGIPSTQGKPDN